MRNKSRSSGKVLGLTRRWDKQETFRAQTFLVRWHISSIKSKGCQLCGYNKCLSAIEFHHTGGKKFELSSCGGRSIETIDAEIKKCIVICANCHRELHDKDIGFVNKEVVVDLQTQLPLSGVVI